MTNLENPNRASTKSILANATNILLFQGDVKVDDNFINELKEHLEKNQNHTQFSFTIGIDGNSDRNSILKELRINCS